MNFNEVVHVNNTLQQDSSHLRTFEGITCHKHKILYEEFEDIRIESVNRRITDNAMAKRKMRKEQTMVYKTYTHSDLFDHKNIYCLT